MQGGAFRLEKDIKQVCGVLVVGLEDEWDKWVGGEVGVCEEGGRGRGMLSPSTSPSSHLYLTHTLQTIYLSKVPLRKIFKKVAHHTHSTPTPCRRCHAPPRHETTRHDTTRHDTTRHDTARHGTTRHDTTRHGTTRHDMTLTRHKRRREQVGPRRKPRPDNKEPNEDNKHGKQPQETRTTNR